MKISQGKFIKFKRQEIFSMRKCHKEMNGTALFKPSGIEEIDSACACCRLALALCVACMKNTRPARPACAWPSALPAGKTRLEQISRPAAAVNVFIALHLAHCAANSGERNNRAAGISENQPGRLAANNHGHTQGQCHFLYFHGPARADEPRNAGLRPEKNCIARQS